MQILAHCRNRSVGTSQPVSGIKRAHWIGCFPLRFIVGIQKNLDACLQWERESATVVSFAQIKILSFQCLWLFIECLLTWMECILLLNQTFDPPKVSGLHVTTEQVELQDYATCQMLSDFLQMQGGLHRYWTQHCKYRMYKKRSLSTRVNPGLCVKAEIVKCNLAWLSRRPKPFMRTCSCYILGSTAACGFQMSCPESC